MENKTYAIRYLSTFQKEFNSILNYITNNLENKIAADNLYKEIITQIERRSKNPESFQIFKKVKKLNINWYTIRVKNFTIFYIVRGLYMDIIRIYPSKRNFDKLI